MRAINLRQLARTNWLALVASVLVLNSVVAQAEVVDRIVAVIDRDVVTLSEAEQAAELRALRGQDALPMSDMVERLIDARLVEREVSRYPEDAVTQQHVDAALESLRAALASPAAFSATLSALGLPEDELDSLVRKQLAIDHYLESRFRPLVYVTDDEVERYYEDVLLPDVATAGEAPPQLASVEVGIRRILEEKLFNQRIDEWIVRLKSRSRIRRYVW